MAVLGPVPKSRSVEDDPPQEEARPKVVKEGNRSLAQVNKEIEQHVGVITRLQLDIQTHKTDLAELVSERNDLEAEALELIGVRQTIVSAGTALPVVTRRQPRARTEGGRTDQDAVREWARRKSWRHPTTGKSLSDRGPIPKQLYEEYDSAT